MDSFIFSDEFVFVGLYDCKKFGELVGAKTTAYKNLNRIHADFCRIVIFEYMHMGGLVRLIHEDHEPVSPFPQNCRHGCIHIIKFG